ncbi:hypothetical protein GXW74_27005 [Roseomonas eburnea]|uniref:Uncharacterized protein n=1 Tax=Neoroseomonas eburnea TaxID=1346889 RepID=A0A9X9XKA7_9PROT|nr:hypothetical protein [Neoroseomonas eburnea]MBR0684143.1 hypothetical protein [Neoroseomonas eburnea]
MVAITSGMTPMSTPLAPLAEAARAATPEAAAVEALEAAVGRQGSAFSAQELERLMAVMAPRAQSAGAGGEYAGACAGMAGALMQDIASTRAGGQDGVLLVFDSGDGSGGMLAMSRADLAAALASDDPGSPGTVTTNDGVTVHFRDLVRRTLGLAGAGDEVDATAKSGGIGIATVSNKDRIAAAIAQMLAATAGDDADADTDPDEAGVRAEQDRQPPATAIAGPLTDSEDGVRVRILGFPADPSAASVGEDGRLIDLHV